MTPFTQQSIAKMLGVSLKTVQRAFNQPETVSPQLRRRILDCASEHGYRPNRSARALQGRSRYRVALVTAAEPAFFWDDVATGLELAAQQIAPLGFDVVYRRAPNQSAFMEALEELTKEGVDCLGLVNHTTVDMRRVLDWVQTRQIPFAAFNVDFESEDRICFLGSDFHRHGEVAGELVTKLMRDGGTLALLTTTYQLGSFLPGADVDEQRRRGVRSVTDLHSNILVVEIPLMENGRDVEAAKVLDRLDGLPGDRRMVFCTAPFPDYLINEIESGRFNDRVEFLGLDLSPRIVRLLEVGAITAEVFQNPMLQGYGIVKLMETYVETGVRPTKDSFVITPQVIFRSNVDQRNNMEVISEISAPLSSPPVISF